MGSFSNWPPKVDYRVGPGGPTRNEGTRAVHTHDSDTMEALPARNTPPPPLKAKKRSKKESKGRLKGGKK